MSEKTAAAIVKRENAKRPKPAPKPKSEPKPE